MDAFQFDAARVGRRGRVLRQGQRAGHGADDADLVVEGDGRPRLQLHPRRRHRPARRPAPHLRRSVPRLCDAPAVEARKAIGNSQNVAQIATAAALDPPMRRRRRRACCSRPGRRARPAAIKLPPSLLALDAGDAVDARRSTASTLPFRIKAVETSTYRVARPRRLRSVAAAWSASPPVGRPGAPRLGSLRAADHRVHGLPPVTGRRPSSGRRASPPIANPWAGVDVYRANGGGGWTYVTRSRRPPSWAS